MNLPCVFYCGWVERSVNANWVKLIDDVFQVLCVITGFLLAPSFAGGRRLGMLSDVSAWLGYGLQLPSQTPIRVLLGRDFADVITVPHQWTLSKGDDLGGPGFISQKTLRAGRRLPQGKRKFLP